MRSRTILIIDDSETLVTHVKRVLADRDQSHRFLSASNGLDGFKALLGNQVDLVLCDLWMPDMDGFKFLSLKRTRSEFADVPVIMLTGAKDIAEKVKGLEAGASDYLTKPFDDEELVARVKVHLKIRALQEELREKNERLEVLSNTDGLTGLTNRRHFLELASIELLRAKRYDTQLALVMIDIDHFKPVNDRFGHQVGDRALVSVASLLGRDLRRHDLAARYGGEEFVMLLPSTGCSGALVVAERYRQLVEASPVTWEEGSHSVTVSLGVAAYPTHPAESIDELLRTADQALYAAKNQGRNRTVVAD